MAVTVTSRLSDELNKDLNEIAKREKLDKSAVVRRLLGDSIKIWKEKYALLMYQKGIFSTEQAADFAGVSLWRFSELLKKYKISLNYDLEELEKDLSE